MKHRILLLARMPASMREILRFENLIGFPQQAHASAGASSTCVLKVVGSHVQALDMFNFSNRSSEAF